MLNMRMLWAVAAAVTMTAISASQSAPAKFTGWLSWRGPDQNGASRETGLPSAWTPGGANHVFEIPNGGQGTPIIANGKLFALVTTGSGGDLQEVLLCADAGTGKKVWEKRFSDFTSDVVYDRYALGSPCVDPETGNVYVISAAGLFTCFTAEGQQVWQHSLMDALGRLTFVNGRNGGPWIDQDFVYFRYITSNWGGEGPASDRIYALDKKNGSLVWSSTPGDRPKDNSFALPVMAWKDGKRLMYTGAGDGSVVCVNARTGQPVWRSPQSAGGFNASALLYQDKVIAVHADENLDAADSGRMVALRTDAKTVPPEMGHVGAPLLERTAEAWRNPLSSTSSSPVLVGNRIYLTDKTGHLDCVNADTGKVLWQHKLAPDQLHASPLYADGKLYVPMTSGDFYIMKPSDAGVQELAKVKLAGRCLGAPSVWAGRVYVMTDQKLYCFGSKTAKPVPPAPSNPMPDGPGKAGPAVALQIIPAEVLLHPGQKATFSVRGIDANGIPTGPYEPKSLTWAKYIPPTARVRAEMNGAFNAAGELVAGAENTPSAGAFEGTVSGLKGYIRGRVMPSLPIKEDFETANLAEKHPTEGANFAYPPLPWIGARFKFDIRDVEGNKVLAKTLDNIFFQRATVYVGTPEMKNYTVEADVMSDGNRRTHSTVGLINQRYLVALMGNQQELEVSSNQERLKASVPFKWVTKTWYRLKTRVDVASDGTGTVRAKAWKKGDPEPAAWTIEVPHKIAHQNGSPGLFGFSPQSLFRVYIDNLQVTQN
jgi:outer membrane protein assembly factor BamB